MVFDKVIFFQRKGVQRELAFGNLMIPCVFGRADHSPYENECCQTVFYVNDQNRARSDPKSRKKEGAPPQNSAIFLILGIAVLR